MIRTKKMLKTATAALLGISVVGCSNAKMTTDEISPDLNPSEAGGCREWDWDDKEGAYVCDDSNHSYYRYYYYDGKLFRNAGILHQNSKYQFYRSTYTPGKSKLPQRVSPSSENNGQSSITGSTTSESVSSGFGKGFFGGTGG